jgi:hypothetical protein
MKITPNKLQLIVEELNAALINNPNADDIYFDTEEDRVVVHHTILLDSDKES